MGSQAARQPGSQAGSQPGSLAARIRRPASVTVTTTTIIIIIIIIVIVTVIVIVIMIITSRDLARNKQAGSQAVSIARRCKTGERLGATPSF